MVRKTLKQYGDGTDLPEQSKFYKEVCSYLDTSYIKLHDLKTSIGTLIFLNGMCLVATICCYKYNMWVLAGFLNGMFSLRLGHESLHYSNPNWRGVRVVTEWIWIVMGWCPYAWTLQHVVGHHQETNTKRDPDIHFDKLLPTNPLKRIISIMFFPLLLVIQIAFITPAQILIQGKALGMKVNDVWKQNVLRWVIYRIIWFAVMRPSITGILIMWYVWGAWFVLFSQASHLPLLKVGCVGDSPTDANQWIRDQIEHSSNFASNSVIWQYLSFGLNTQIEHHLFQNVGHEHHLKLQPFVKQFCAENGIVYRDIDGGRALYESVKRLCGFEPCKEL